MKKFNIKKGIAVFTVITALTAGLAGCGSNANTAETAQTAATTETTETQETEETKVLKVAATSVPHAEILEEAKSLLEQEGYTLEITEFQDYVQPNNVVEDGDYIANYFQHAPYLDDFNAENGTHLVAAAIIHYEPFGIYPGVSDSLEDIEDGAKIAVPNDTTNEARALLLLQDNGIITLKEGAGLSATINDIEENPHNVELVELEAAQVPRVVGEVDFVVLNGNYALEAGFNVANDAIAAETADSEAAQTYANIICVREGNENNAAVQALINVLQGDHIKQFIEEKYEGAVVPIS